MGNHKLRKINDAELEYLIKLSGERLSNWDDRVARWEEEVIKREFVSDLYLALRELSVLREAVKDFKGKVE